MVAFINRERISSIVPVAGLSHSSENTQSAMLEFTVDFPVAKFTPGAGAANGLEVGQKLM